MATAATPRLTTFSHGAGCACKLGPADLTEVLAALEDPPRPREVLVAGDTGDDAAVWALPDGRALVATLDVFTPVVDDAYDWGRIAAANAFSDVYAMGGTPAFALNMAGWPVDELPTSLLAEVLRGGQAVAAEAGAPVLGGHTITTERVPIYGMVAVGFADADRLIRNDAARPGDDLVLTKPLGIGILTTAIKRELASPARSEAAVATMTTLNAAASRAALRADVRAGTDVTGFGLLGHLRRMLEARGCAATVDAGAVPTLDGVLDLARAGIVPSGTKRNHAWLQAFTVWGELTPPDHHVLADAQTSGGLLLATSDAPALLEALRAEGVAGVVIGRCVDGAPGIVVGGRVAD
jgi:selenide,water dikinase